MENERFYFLFRIGRDIYAVDLDIVQKVIRAVALIPIPETSLPVLGLINIHGSILPVLDIRNKLRLPARGMGIHDRIVISCVEKQFLSFVVDAVVGVYPIDQWSIHPSQGMHPELAECIDGVGRFNEHTAVILNLSKLFNISQISELAQPQGNKSN